MNSNFFPKLLVLGIVGTVAFIYFDPLRPKDEEVKSAILACLLATYDGEVTSVDVGHSFTGGHAGDGVKVRLWPVTATVVQGKKEHPYHDFLVWKSEDGHWNAEYNDPKNSQWTRIGLMGWGKFGL
jgi:hypothetical protein